MRASSSKRFAHLLALVLQTHHVKPLPGLERPLKGGGLARERPERSELRQALGAVEPGLTVLEDRLSQPVHLDAPIMALARSLFPHVREEDLRVAAAGSSR